MILAAKAEYRWALFTAGLWLVVGLFFSQTARAEVKAEDDFYANTLTSAKVLQQWYNKNGLWDSAGWWNGANCLEAIESVIEATNGREYRDVLRNTFEKNSEKDFLNEYYDDEGWWTLAWIRAYDLTGERRYLAMAEKIFDDMKGGWDDHCNGGIWWKKEHRYKNAIANELFLLTAIRLHQRAIDKEKAGGYLDWAKREWDWFKQTGMINTNNLVNDGLNRYCENNGRTTWTYNQGVIMGGLVELYLSTGDTNCLMQAVSIADASIKTLVSAKGVLEEPRESAGLHGADVPQFKGIFVRHLAELYDITGNRTYRDFLVQNAHAVWRDDRDQTNRFGGHWGGPIDEIDAVRHSSAMRVITALAEPVTTNLIFIKTAGSPDCQHEVGAAAGTAAWGCDEACQAGYAIAGPGLTSLPVGPLDVQFRMSVSKLSKSEEKLARLEVFDLSGGTVVASRDLTWKEFREANQSQSFSVSFTNAVQDKPLQFRVYWNGAPKSPALTISDVSLGGSRNWSAANLDHELGRPNRFNHWSADPARDKSSGFLTKGPGTTELSPGEYDVCFELKVDNFNRNDSTVATISVMDAETKKVVASRELRRSDFASTLYHTFSLRVNTVAGQRLEFRTFWHYATNTPRLTQRSVVVKPHTKDSVKVAGE